MEQELLELAQTIVSECQADQAEAVVQDGTEAVSRFANNVLHQNMQEWSRRIDVRVLLGKRVGCASGTVADLDDARRVVAKATELARVAGEIPDFESFAEPQPIPEAPPAVAEDVIQCTPAQRGALVEEALDVARERSLAAAGALSVRSGTLTVANSLGVAAVHSSTATHFHVVMQDEDSAGYASAEGRSLADTRVREVAERAADKATLGRNPRHIKAEPLAVVLEPVAAAELLDMFSFGFNALLYQEQKSFVCDYLGQQACTSFLNLTDDGLDPRTNVRPFDFEGLPRRRVELIKDGAISGLVHNTYTAARAKPPTQSTGHATQPPGRWGPLPRNLIVSPGEGSLEDLIARVDRGLFISRIHYLNCVHPRKTILTGMTREGTFLIEQGQITGAVHNLRFTERFVDALGRIAAIGCKGERHGSVWTPPLLIESFSFTSETEF
ncbi:MAG: TldD/PmbA family protein [Armatimonadota bacterium]